MKALVAILIFFATFVCATATDALILISPEQAKPVVDENSYIQGEWVLWPPADRPSGSNRLMSLLTRSDWSGISDSLIFGLGDGKHLSDAVHLLNRRGYFAARDRVLDTPSFAVGDAAGGAQPAALFLALSGRHPTIEVRTLGQSWGPGVAFSEASGWDEVEAIVRKAGGRVLVLEYPPRAGERWSRYWLRGSGWGDKLPMWDDWGVPGLIPASAAGDLVLRPSRFDWQQNDTANWGGANRWFSFIAYSSPLTFAVIGFFGAFFVGCAAYLISLEERPKFAGTAVKYLTLAPASLLFSGILTRLLGMQGWALWELLSFLSMCFVAQALGAVLKQAAPRANPMLAICVVGTAACVATNPLWSVYSNVFGSETLPLAPQAAGAFYGYLVGFSAFSRGSGFVSWVGRASLLAIFVWGASMRPWWSAGQWPFALLPLVALLVGEGWFRAWMLAPLALLPLSDGSIIRHGLTWAPGDLYTNDQARKALNLARDAEFFSSQGFLGAALVVGSLSIFIERYFFHEIRRSLLRDSRLRALFHASFAAAAMGVFQPLLLHAALICFVGGTLVLLADTARTL